VYDVPQQLTALRITATGVDPAATAGTARPAGVADLDLVNRFVRDIAGATRLRQLHDVMCRATHALSFDHYALTQRAPTGDLPGPVRLGNYPESWLPLLAGSALVGDDPVLLASERSLVPFVWDDLDAIVPLNDRQRAYMALAGRHGLANGYTVPIHVPGEGTGVVCFVVGEGRPLPKGTLPAAQYLACYAFEAARRIGRERARTGQPPPRLTPRQRDCLVLAARGKSNWVAGQLLGLSAATVHKYLEAAKQRYGVASRTELVVRALYDGQLRFADIVYPQAGDSGAGG
jgi:LuxR family quorum-sensing system transcriptional regulator CciR